MKGQGGISWDEEVKKVWNGLGETKDEILSILESAEYKNKSKGHDRNNGMRGGRTPSRQ